ncbi:transposase [Rhodoferax sp.]|uniref:IS66-like element accessory protein TnpA n=2 Tax=Rhodoferax sp. TaxID=50421 RepID=UPI002723E03B|nr:transposase [Rhodoferax sp.]MDO9199176.1 transposase [Rhodoferax sp.]
MKIVDTMSTPSTHTQRRRRFYSAELKSLVVAQCRQSGASIAGVALSHQVNANIVHRWIREEQQRAEQAQVQGRLAAFVPLTIEAPAVNKPSEPDAIRVQVQRPTGMVTVNWPVQDGGACAAWLREWLK